MQKQRNAITLKLKPLPKFSSNLYQSITNQETEVPTPNSPGYRAPEVPIRARVYHASLCCNAVKKVLPLDDFTSPTSSALYCRFVIFCLLLISDLL